MIARTLSLPTTRSFFLFGARQTGKTTLLRETFREFPCLKYDLLRTDEYMRLAARPALFREEVLGRAAAIRHVVVDEIQRVPGLLNEIHLLLEQDPALCFAMTGSSARKLKRGHANLLAGRAWLRHLFPLTEAELGGTVPLARTLAWGTLPAVLAQDDAGARETLKSYTEVYLKEEIEAEAVLRASGPFIRFLTLAAHLNGELLNFSNIARDCGVSHVTVKAYYGILEDTLVGRLLLPWHRSQRGRLSTHPRFYFFDTGVVRALQKQLGVPLEPGTSAYGRLFETRMINETISLADYHDLDCEFSHFRTAAGGELDLIVETPAGHTLAIEFKSGEAPVLADCRGGLRAFREHVPGAQCLCVSCSPRARRVDGVRFLPWQEYLRWVAAGFPELA